MHLETSADRQLWGEKEKEPESCTERPRAHARGEREGARDSSILFELLSEKLKEKDEEILKLRLVSTLNIRLVSQIEELNRLMRRAAAGVVAASETTPRQDSFQLPHSFEPETMPELIQIQELEELTTNIENLLNIKTESSRRHIESRELTRSNSQSEIPEKVRMVLEEKNQMIATMREEIHDMKLSLGLGVSTDQPQSLSEEMRVARQLEEVEELTATQNRTCLAGLEQQEQRIIQAQKENEEAERETERKLKDGWQSDCDEEIETETEDFEIGPSRRSESVDQLSRLVRRELELSDQLDKTILSLQDERDTLTSGLGDSELIDSRLDSLSQQIVEKLIDKISSKGLASYLGESTSLNNKASPPVRSEVYLEVSPDIHRREVEKLTYQLEQERYNLQEIQAAICKERQQSLSLMEKLNSEKRTRQQLEEDVTRLQEELTEMQTQLLRHREEIEELDSLYQSEKNQNSTLEEALAAERENFNKLIASLDKERQRSRDVSVRDTDTIMELRTALEVEKERGSRLSLVSPMFGRKSLYSSRHSLPGYRSPGLPEIAIDKAENLLEELMEERSRCDRLKECLEMERDKYLQLEHSTQLELQELMNQVELGEEAVLESNRKLEQLEEERSLLAMEVEKGRDTMNKLTQEIEELEVRLQRPRPESQETQLHDAFYVEDLEAKLEAHRDREAELEREVKLLQTRLAEVLERPPTTTARSTPLPLSKSSSFILGGKNVPLDPQDQAYHFYRLLLRAESYRKALIWQKKYISLLLSSYQETEMAALGRLARMSGSRRTLVIDTAPGAARLRFKVVVLAVTAIGRMRFLVRRWRRSRRSPRRGATQEKEVVSAQLARLPTRQETMTRTPELGLVKL